MWAVVCSYGLYRLLALLVSVLVVIGLWLTVRGLQCLLYGMAWLMSRLDGL